MRIALITEYSEIGGGETNILRLAQRLKELCIDCVLFCPPGKLLEKAKEKNLDVQRIEKVKKRWFWFLPIPSLFPSMLKYSLRKFDLIHVYSLNILPLLFGVKKPIVWTNHGYWEGASGLRAFTIRSMVNRVITVSSDVHDKALFPNKLKRKIYLGAISEKQILTNVNRTSVNLGIVKICCIGRFQKVKGQDLLLESLAHIDRQSIDNKIEVSIVGDVNGTNPEDILFKQHLEKRIEEINQSQNIQVRMMGFQEDIYSFVDSCHFVIIPSRYESFSMVSVESLSRGKPVIAPNIGGPKDIIMDEENGLLFKPGDYQDLAKVIIKAIEKYTFFDTSTILNSSFRFTIEKQADGLVQTYKELLES